MRPRGIFNRSVRRRFELVAIIPVIMVVVLLTGLSTHTRIRDAIDTLDNMGVQSTRYLGLQGELALYSGNTPALESILDHGDWPDDLAGGAFFDTSFDLLAKSARFPWPDPLPAEWHRHQTLDGRYQYYVNPVYLTNIDVEDYQNDVDVTPTLTGYSLVAVDLSDLHQLRRDTILNATIVAAVATILASLLGRVLASTITAPIREFSRGLQALQQGQLNTRVTAHTKDELAILAEGINSLAQSVQEGQRDLQANVDKATHQLQEAMADLRHKNLELDQARIITEQSAKTREEFLARMSHELRTPLTAITGFLKLLDPARLNAKERHYCNIIQQSTDLLLKHIDDILAFSRLSSGKVTLENSSFLLDECIGSVLAQTQPAALEKNIELVLDIGTEVQLARYGDSFRLHQILANLISNALKFTQEGWVEIIFRNADDDALQIIVSDTGVGIRPDRLPQIFAPFAQGDTSTTRRFGGTGLGLAIVKNLVELMGGKITVDSTVGEGSRFLVTLPLPPSNELTEPARQNIRVLLYARDLSPIKPHNLSLERFFSRFDIVRDPRQAFEANPDDYDVLMAGLRLTEGQLTSTMDVLLSSWPKPMVILSTPGVDSVYYQQIVERRAGRPLAILSPTSVSDLTEGVRMAIESGDSLCSPSPKDTSGETLSGLKFLIAEDNRFNRLLLEELITRHGGDFTSATDGYEALLHAETEPYDVLLVDIHMPGLGGEESVRRIRTQSTLNGAKPIIALTADVLQMQQQALDKAGIDALLLKPLDEQALLLCILDLVGRADKTGLLPATEPPPSLLKKYHAELDNLLRQCHDAWQRREREALGEVLHQLLGVAGVFRRPELAKQVQRAHHSLRDGGLDRFGADFEKLEALILAEISEA